MAVIKKTARIDVLENDKKIKSDELSIQTKEHILNGFNHEISGITYHFSYDNEAQMNLQDTMRLFDNNMINTVNWTAKLHSGKVRLILTKKTFEGMYMTSVKHKLNTISYYRDVLIPRIELCKTKEELDLIQWNDDEISDISQLKEDNTLEKRIEEVSMAQAQGDYELLSIIMMGMI